MEMMGHLSLSAKYFECRLREHEYHQVGLVYSASYCSDAYYLICSLVLLCRVMIALYLL